MSFIEMLEWCGQEPLKRNCCTLTQLGQLLHVFLNLIIDIKTMLFDVYDLILGLFFLLWPIITAGINKSLTPKLKFLPYWGHPQMIGENGHIFLPIFNFKLFWLTHFFLPGTFVFVPYCENIYLKKKGSWGKISYERRAYESVDDERLS